ncbi:hypothetical protein GCM10009712_20350 [Pseudarthrobacter sulfonivorans]|uniref:hypothetical protein n=1 Tax=Pseudarthrobacter sulfonivorans TaxID=121292 RepID=UPI001CC27C22|nr:hypothetical protein [Pseudarthrobacter sulfonivorans]
MKKTILTAVLVATAMLSTGCTVEAVTGTVAEQAAEGSAGQAVGPVSAMEKAKEEVEAKAYAARVVAANSSMMAGLDWAVSGGGWEAGAKATVTLRSAEGTAICAPAGTVADDKGNFDGVLTIPEGTTTGTYSLEAAYATGPHTTTVNVFSA